MSQAGSQVSSFFFFSSLPVAMIDGGDRCVLRARESPSWVDGMSGGNVRSNREGLRFQFFEKDGGI